MARLQIGGGSTRVGEVYLDMLFRQRALDNARAEAAQRAQIESARLQASERNAEREAQMQMLQMQQQANLAREARAASQAENQAQRQFAAEQQAASLGWDKEKLAKEIESRESMAAARDKSEEAADRRRFAQQESIAKLNDELAQKRQNLELVATIAQSDPEADVEALKDMAPIQLASYAGKAVKKAKTADEQKALLDKFASNGLEIPGMMTDAQRSAAAAVQVERKRQEGREDLQKAEARNDKFAIFRAETKMKHADSLAELLVKSQVKDDMGGIMFNSELYNRGKEELDTGFKNAIDGLGNAPKTEKQAAAPSPATKAPMDRTGAALSTGDKVFKSLDPKYQTAEEKAKAKQFGQYFEAARQAKGTWPNNPLIPILRGVTNAVDPFGQAATRAEFQKFSPWAIKAMRDSGMDEGSIATQVNEWLRSNAPAEEDLLMPTINIQPVELPQQGGWWDSLQGRTI